MEIKLFVLILSLLTMTGLAAGCAQAATSPAPQKPVAATSEPNVSPAVVTTGQSSNVAKPTENDAPPSPPAVKAETEATKISDILQNPKTYDGKTVTITGKIVSECGSGCWFTLQDGNAVIYIDLAPNNMVIPQKKGSSAKVIGKVIREGSDVYMVGSRVDF